MTGLRRLPALAFALLVAGCGSEAPPPAPPPPPVSVLRIATKPVPNIVELPARVQAIRTAEVRARVDGIVERRAYQEGTDVRAGALLFRIDPRENQAAFASAQASLARARATAVNARQVVQRYRPLVGQQAISRQEYEAAVAASSQAQADVAAAQAALARARLDLNYTSVTAPISGRVGRAEVTEGALVSAASATLLTRIEQLDPIYVNFSQSSSDLLRLRQDIAAGRVSAPSLHRVRVTLVMEDGTPFPYGGHLDFLDLAVDESTGTVSLRAEFPNPERLLLPGQFVRARIEGGMVEGGVTVPQRAVQITPQGATVFIVGRDNVAAQRPVQLGALQGSEWVVRSGLKAGDRVILSNLQKVRPGSPVTILPARPVRGAPPAPAPAPAATAR